MKNRLIEVLHAPTVVREWGPSDWNAFIPLARAARLLGRCLALFEQAQLIDAVPARLVDHLRGALAQTRYVQVQARREWRHVQKTLHASGIDVLPLKGIAYLLGDLPPAGWRNMSDIDVLVPGDDVERAERALKRAGWVASGDYDDYDEHYYRAWMHEVPPLKHPKRAFEVDLHHNLAPPVSRVPIDAALLWQAARDGEVQPDQPNGLAPVDLLLHNAIHLFMNDELRGGLRDVVDFRDLYAHFSQADAGFESVLLARARQLRCERPLYYAATTAQRLAGLQVSDAFADAIARIAPPKPVCLMMQGLIDRVLASSRPGSARGGLADQALFVRSHWIRMPPAMLARHLTHKWLKRRRSTVTADDLPG